MMSMIAVIVAPSRVGAPLLAEPVEAWKGSEPGSPERRTLRRASREAWRWFLEQCPVLAPGHDERMTVGWKPCRQDWRADPATPRWRAMADLIITNGDSAAGLLAAAGKAGRILPWRDVLHEGPLVAGPLESCSRVRAAFLARGSGSNSARSRPTSLRGMRCSAPIPASTGSSCGSSTTSMTSCSSSRFSPSSADTGRRDGLFLVQADDFLGSQRADTILKFASRARPLDDEDLDLARRGLGRPDHADARGNRETARAPDDRLPFLPAALHRFLEELPVAGKPGCTRTEAAALAALSGRRARPSEVFRLAHRRRGSRIHGRHELLLSPGRPDAWRRPADFRPAATGGRAGRATSNASRTRSWSSTNAGEEVLAGRADRLALGGIDRWWGGTGSRTGTSGATIATR